MKNILPILSAELHCHPSDFFGNDNLVTLSRPCEKGWRYRTEPPFFRMVSFGACAVMTAHECLHPFLRSYARSRDGYMLFELPNLAPLSAELRKYGYTLSQTTHWFTDRKREVPCRHLQTALMEGKALIPFSDDARFPNAIPNEYAALAILALDGDEIMGLAGCSEDADGIWQIGVDVCPAYRGRGVGTELVRLVKEEVYRRGGVPLYVTGVSNYHSWNLALSAGFRPAWIEIEAFIGRDIL